MAVDDSTRISNAERDQVVATVSEHYALGRLDLAELDERAGRALSAQTQGQLLDVLADLPSLPQAPDLTRTRVAATQPAKRPAVRPHSAIPSSHGWSPWALTAVICLVIWLSTSLAAGEAGYFWPFWVIVPWGAALASRSVALTPRAVRGSRQH